MLSITQIDIETIYSEIYECSKCERSYVSPIPIVKVWCFHKSLGAAEKKNPTSMKRKDT